MTFKAFFEQHALSNSQYHAASNLSPQHRALLAPQEFWRIAYIHNINPSDVLVIRGVFSPRDPGEYRDTLDEWLTREYDFLARQLGKSPTRAEFLLDAKERATEKRCCLWYLLKAPQKMELSKTMQAHRHYEVAQEFLMRADHIGESERYLRQFFPHSPFLEVPVAA